MKNIKIDVDIESTEQAVFELEHIIGLIQQGFTSGGGWDLNDK